MTAFPSLFNRSESFFLGLSGKLFGFGAGSSFGSFLSATSLVDLLLDPSELLHFSKVFLLFNDLENFIVWLPWLLDLVRVVLCHLALSMQQILKRSHINFLFSSRIRSLLLGSWFVEPFPERWNFLVSFALVKDFVRVRLHIVHHQLRFNNFLLRLTVLQFLVVKHFLDLLSIRKLLDRVVVWNSFKAGFLFVHVLGTLVLRLSELLTAILFSVLGSFTVEIATSLVLIISQLWNPNSLLLWWCESCFVKFNRTARYIYMVITTCVDHIGN